MREPSQFPFKNLIGKPYGERVVLRFHSGNTGQTRKWVCRCACGSERAVLEKTLRFGRAKTCGCGINTQGRPSGRSKEDQARSAGGGYATKAAKTVDEIIDDTFASAPRDILKRLGIAC